MGGALRVRFSGVGDRGACPLRLVGVFSAVGALCGVATRFFLAGVEEEGLKVRSEFGFPPRALMPFENMSRILL